MSSLLHNEWTWQAIAALSVVLFFLAYRVGCER